ncbi:TPA: divalent-cation tolerance protein CutA [Candidatus Avigastranaerophilus faecigallinarum]|nr:divalent-cation tolerance protein CutA [Candidatus Avigastranaerophilus faecigallinarum]
MAYCIINCTTKNKEEAIYIAKSLVERKLIACCNIVPSITSVYEWKNDLCCDEECLMVMKTKTELFNEVEIAIKKLHTYDTPEIICIPINNGSSEYLSWVNKQTK